MSRAVAVFGGSFNPPHIGHVLAATFVLSMEEVDALWVVPCFRHPFSKSLAPFDHRLAMCERAFGWLPGVEVSRIERDLGGESRTIRTLRHLAEQHPTWRLRLVIGTDILAEASHWQAFDEVQRIAPPIVLGRQGWEHPTAQKGLFPEVSSSQVREALGRGDPRWARAWVPPPVLAYATEHALYGEPRGH